MPAFHPTKEQLYTYTMRHVYRTLGLEIPEQYYLKDARCKDRESVRRGRKEKYYDWEREALKDVRVLFKTYMSYTRVIGKRGPYNTKAKRITQLKKESKLKIEEIQNKEI